MGFCFLSSRMGGENDATGGKDGMLGCAVAKFAMDATDERLVDSA